MASPFTPRPPPGDTVSIRILNSGTYISIACDVLLNPAISKFDALHRIPCLVFLVEHPSGRKLLFDLGSRKDWQNLAPAVAKSVKELHLSVEVEKSALEVLEEGGVRGEEIEGIIWSHWHWDHIGDPSTFPPHVNVIVGPGFKDAFLPGYPADPNAVVLESDFANRTLIEIAPAKLTHQIGPFRAHDYFGDGSFYILSTPGHAIGHISGLARTSKDPDTFVFMGGDLCHHAGQIRPSRFLPLPTSIEPNPFFGAGPAGSDLGQIPACPGSLLEPLQVARGRKTTEPFFITNFAHDLPTALKTVGDTQEADADENVWFVYAHDPSLAGAVEFYPGCVDDWKERDLARRLRWVFLRDFRDAVGD
ncbi:beta-lactamase-like protein [Aspergillus aurantiobrunneus]